MNDLSRAITTLSLLIVVPIIVQQCDLLGVKDSSRHDQAVSQSFELAKEMLKPKEDEIKVVSDTAPEDLVIVDRKPNIGLMNAYQMRSAYHDVTEKKLPRLSIDDLKPFFPKTNPEGLSNWERKESEAIDGEEVPLTLIEYTWRLVQSNQPTQRISLALVDAPGFENMIELLLAKADVPTFDELDSEFAGHPILRTQDGSNASWFVAVREKNGAVPDRLYVFVSSFAATSEQIQSVLDSVDPEFFSFDIEQVLDAKKKIAAN